MGIYFLFLSMIYNNELYFRTTINPVINNISSNSDKPPLLQINEQQQSSPVKSKSKSPIEQTHRRHSDRRSR